MVAHPFPVFESVNIGVLQNYGAKVEYRPYGKSTNDIGYFAGEGVGNGYYGLATWESNSGSEVVINYSTVIVADSPISLYAYFIGNQQLYKIAYRTGSYNGYNYLVPPPYLYFITNLSVSSYVGSVDAAFPINPVYPNGAAFGDVCQWAYTNIERSVITSADTGIPITYLEVNSIVNGPAYGQSGSVVTCNISFPSGYEIRDTIQGSGISVYNEDGYIPFNYSNNALTFTVP